MTSPINAVGQPSVSTVVDFYRVKSHLKNMCFLREEYRSLPMHESGPLYVLRPLGVQNAHTTTPDLPLHPWYEVTGFWS
jgi:hypothetical protein